MYVLGQMEYERATYGTGQHLFQSYDWGEIAVVRGWQPIRIKSSNTTHCLPFTILRFPLPGRLCALYTPRGPTCRDPNALLETIEELLPEISQLRPIFWRVDPNYEITSEPLSALRTEIGPSLTLRDTISRPILPNPTWKIQFLDGPESAESMTEGWKHPPKGLTFDFQATEQNLKVFYAMLQEKAHKRKLGLMHYDVIARIIASFARGDRCHFALVRKLGQCLGGSLTVIHQTGAYNLYLETRGYLGTNDPSVDLLEDVLRWAKSRGTEFLEFARANPVEDYIWKENTGLFAAFGAVPVSRPGEMDIIFRPLLYQVLRIVKPIRRWVII